MPPTLQVWAMAGDGGLALPQPSLLCYCWPGSTATKSSVSFAIDSTALDALFREAADELGVGECIPGFFLPVLMWVVVNIILKFSAISLTLS